jgi:hypothetical protein
LPAMHPVHLPSIMLASVAFQSAGRSIVEARLRLCRLGRPAGAPQQSLPANGQTHQPFFFLALRFSCFRKSSVKSSPSFEVTV